MLIVLTTVASAEEAAALAQKSVELKLAACVQILPQMTSVYFWKGEVRKEPEQLLLIKTLPEKWDELCEFINLHHSYDVPEIIAIQVERVSEVYANWIADYLK